VAEGGADSRTDVLPEAPAERVRVLLEHLVEELGLEASVAVEEGDDEIHADIEGEEVGLLIGRHGQTIDAIQLLSYQAAFRGRQDRKRVTVDAAGYRRRQGESLRRRADMAAEDALAHGEAVEMDPMGSNERRVVHEHLRDRPEIETYSEGEEPNRCVVIAPLVSD
jgi:spoIIIJ-associated protein